MDRWNDAVIKNNAGRGSIGLSTKRATLSPVQTFRKKSKYRIELLYTDRRSKPAPVTEDEKCTNTYEVIFTSKVAC